VTAPPGPCRNDCAQSVARGDLEEKGCDSCVCLSAMFKSADGVLVCLVGGMPSGSVSIFTLPVNKIFGSSPASSFIENSLDFVSPLCDLSVASGSQVLSSFYVRHDA
jgi:hypothetical protein